MIGENKKLITISLITLLLIVILVCLLFVDFPFLGVYSIKTTLNKHEEIVTKEAELVSQQKAYTSLNSDIENAESNYKKEKAKYEAISDDTVKIINDLVTEENYSVEFMWIRLGNYAKKHDLEIIMVEPGNEQNNSQNTSTDEEDKSVVSKENTSSEKKEEDSENSGTLKVQVIGSYLNLADFVFEVENDSELRFKLDNIVMEQLSGDTIKTTFDVNNIIVYR